MTGAATHSLGGDFHDPPLPMDVGMAVSRWLTQRHPRDTDKLVSNEVSQAGYGLDPRTVANIRGGHLSGKTLTVLLWAYGWPMLRDIGEVVLGESIEKSIDRELERLAVERRGIDAEEQKLRAVYARISARRSVDRSGLLLVPEEADKPGI